MTHRARRAAVALGLLLGGLGCRPDPPPLPAAATAPPGEPIPGLTLAESGRFRAGHALFNTVFRPEQGLGPAFNENQCSACHTSPASGGVGGERVLRATRWNERTGCDLLSDQGGENVRRKITAWLRATGAKPENLPAGAVAGRFTAPALYGLGLVEAIPDSVLEALADSDDRDGDGISGRIGRSADGRPARFGRKADVATLPGFVATAAHQEMGLTSPDRQVDLVRGRPAPPAADPAADPELAAAALALLSDYVRLLAPPGRGAPPPGWTAERIAPGERIFGQIGCVRCHTPALPTGASPFAPLRQRRVALYSDLLLHDMGPELADVCGPGARPSEVRTEPLLGLRYRDLLLHDGRTTSVADAILRHDGEAALARDRFAGLPVAEREALLAWLATL